MDKPHWHVLQIKKSFHAPRLGRTKLQKNVWLQNPVLSGSDH